MFNRETTSQPQNSAFNFVQFVLRNVNVKVPPLTILEGLLSHSWGRGGGYYGEGRAEDKIELSSQVREVQSNADKCVYALNVT